MTSRSFEEAYQERNTVSTIMIALGKAKTPATAKRIETDHLDITSDVSDEVVAPGTLFSVVFDVKPNAGIHLYAPGAKDYKIISGSLEYQACDDRLCFTSRSIPVSYTVKVRRLDTERATVPK